MTLDGFYRIAKGIYVAGCVMAPLGLIASFWLLLEWSMTQARMLRDRSRKLTEETSK